MADKIPNDDDLILIIDEDSINVKVVPKSLNIVVEPLDVTVVVDEKQNLEIFPVSVPFALQGQSGVSGYSGYSGPQGFSGYSGAPGSDGGGGGGDTVKVSITDTTSDYLGAKLVAGTGITLTPINTGFDESLVVSLYTYPQFVGFSNNVNTVEKGSTVTQVILSWSKNKVFTSQSLNQGIGTITASAINYTDNSTFSTNRTYTITGSDGTTSTSASTSVSFVNKRYYGTNTNTSLINSQILALNNEFASSRANTHTYNCAAGTYIWVCYPASLGLATFYVSGLESTFTLTIQNVTNSSGYTESFNCYRSTQLQHGSDITLVVN